MKIGLLGGTFDPVHEGHLSIAKQALQQCHLDLVEFIPCFTPPHRAQPTASPQQRYDMLMLAMQSTPQFAVNNIEIQKHTISYTIDTVLLLQQKRSQDDFYLIVGADAFMQFTTWREWQKLISLVHVIIVSRHHHEITIPKDISDYIEKNSLQNHIHCCTIDPILISATRIRSDIAAHKHKVDGLPHLVHEYIVKHQLYSA